MRTPPACCLLVLLVGCTSLDDVRNDRTGGTTESYPGTKASLFQASLHVLRKEGAEAVEQDAEQGTLFGMIHEDYLANTTTYCGVWVEAKEEGTVQVRVVTRRRRSVSLLTGLTESTFHEDLKRELGLLPPIPGPRLKGK